MSSAKYPRTGVYQGITLCEVSVAGLLDMLDVATAVKLGVVSRMACSCLKYILLGRYWLFGGVEVGATSLKLIVGLLHVETFSTVTNRLITFPTVPVNQGLNF